jgi:hypothetical protein
MRPVVVKQFEVPVSARCLELCECHVEAIHVDLREPLILPTQRPTAFDLFQARLNAHATHRLWIGQTPMTRSRRLDRQHTTVGFCDAALEAGVCTHPAGAGAVTIAAA